MRNSLLHSWKEPQFAPNWSIDAAPRFRLGLLFTVFALPVLAVAARLLWLQVVIPDRFLVAWTATRETFESIPAEEGRILARDGQVLAFDQPCYSIQVHYRWLEEPVDPGWLKARAREKLSRADRKNKQLLEAAQAEIVLQREQLWRELSHLTGLSADELSRRRSRIQSRVESIAQQVEQRRAKRDLPSSSPGDSVWKRLWQELSTPPERENSDPIIVREELESHSVLDQVPIDQIATIEAQPSRFPGVEVRSTSERIYPYGDLAAHLIGWRSAVDQSEIEKRKVRFPDQDPLALEVGDHLGRSGIERSCDSQVRGIRGLKRVVRNYAGEIIETEIVRPPENGADLTLAIDIDLQREAERLLDGALTAPANDPQVIPPQAGAVVILDIRSGEILTAASGPRFNLRTIQHPTAEQWKSWSDDPRSPFLSRVSHAAAAPGSLFHVVTAIAGLEQGFCSPTQMFHCQGYLNDPEHDCCAIFRILGQGHGDLDVATAIARSCHVYFYSMVESMGPDPLEHWSRQLGFGSPTGIELLGERSGRIPSRSRASREQRWYPGTTRQFAIGQADLTVTPLQVARLMAILGRGGRPVTPHVRITPPASPPEIELATASEPAPLISPRTVAVVQEGLISSVTDPEGNGHSAEVPGLKIAGKSGTADVAHQLPSHAWFAGYVPADNPQYSFVVYLEHGGSGDLVAAPLARQLILSMIESDRLRVER